MGMTLPGKPRAKYRNTPTVSDGLRFDSKREAKRWGELRLMERAGLIENLERQVRFPLKVNGVLVCTYVADFVYREGATRARVVEDAKGFRTREYQIKRKLMKAVHGIEIAEV